LSPVSLELAPRDLMVRIEQGTPGAIAERDRSLG
jgi:hypothetical protein